MKKGQIYYSDIFKRKLVVTWISADETRVHYVGDDGFVVEGRYEKNPKDMKLVAEYSDWKDAIKSKEFNNKEIWIPLSKLGQGIIDFDLIPSDEFLECVRAQGFVDDDGDGYPVIKSEDGTLLYKDECVYPSEIENKEKLDFDFVAWFNR